MDRDEIRATFADRGIVRLDGAFTADEAARMRAAMWRHLERRLGVTEHDAESWPDGWLPVSWKPIKRNAAFRAVVESDAVTEALDATFEPSGWEASRSGAQVLFSFPTGEPWTLPAGWHMDCGFERPTWPVFAAKLFAFAGEVGPGGGGTMLLTGSHRLVERYRASVEEPPAGGMENWRPFLRRHPPLGDLLVAGGRPDGGRSLVGQRFVIDDVPVDVVELVGEPGDVVIAHLHVFHAGSPNTSGVPRQMVAMPIFASA
jgi:hypothetical protein